ncbi:acyltransferase [Mycolicibacterium litorale]|nr:acyltransferase [Mycolicibacterium litorale]
MRAYRTSTRQVTLRNADSDSASEQQRTQASNQSRFRPDIEGLRAVAVLAVVLFHAGVPGLSGGFVGVDVFFVISGFLITRLLWREVSTKGTVRLRNFYGARARRLLPASATVGIFILISSAALLPVLQARSVIWDGIASALYVSNYRFIADGVDYLAVAQPPSPFQHYWSLGVEEQFYLVWPALILGTGWLVRRWHRRTSKLVTATQRPYLTVLAIVMAVSFTLSLIITYIAPPVAFFSLPTRAWQLAAGGVVALTSDNWLRLSPRVAAITGWAGLGVILLACTMLTPTTLYPGVAALLPTLGSLLVIGAGCATPTLGCGRLLGLSPMRAIGRISYSWYLWHWPILLVALWSLAPALGHTLWFGMGGALLSAGLAALTVRFIEDPLRFAPKIQKSASRSLTLGGIATGTVVFVGVALLVLVPLPVGRGPEVKPVALTVAIPPAGSPIASYDAAVRHVFAEVQAALAASANLEAVPSNLDPPLAQATPKDGLGSPTGCLRGFFEVGQPECALADTASSTSVALLGDSNAAMWVPAFQQAAERRHWRLEIMAKADCPFLDIPINNPAAGREYTECERWRGQVMDRLKTQRTRLIVLGMTRLYGANHGWDPGFTSYDQAWLDGLTRMVQHLRGIGARVLVLGPIPDPRSVVPDCLSRHLDDATHCSPTRKEAVNGPGVEAESRAVNAGGGQYADLTELFCTNDRCPVIVGNTLVYVDLFHVTREYSRLLSPAMEALGERTFAHE